MDIVLEDCIIKFKTNLVGTVISDPLRMEILKKFDFGNKSKLNQNL